MRGNDDELWKQTSRLLRRRPGWTVQAFSTPGASTFWCFARGTKMELSVVVENDAINIFLSGSDQQIVLDSVEDLVAWLTSNRSGSLQKPNDSIIDKLKSGRLFRWE